MVESGPIVSGDEFDLQRFVTAQETVYPKALVLPLLFNSRRVSA